MGSKLRRAISDPWGWRMIYRTPDSRRRMAEMIELGPFVAQHLLIMETEFTIRKRATTEHWRAVANVNEVLEEYA